ncbi:50S ribosomal protein L1 [Candidatus Micrarchaeota archaeon]|nr:50S ribosomal protein L1 [Candidatus Micrarchaeota archaeon]
MDKKKLTDSLAKLLEEKGKRQFKQSVELIVNVRSVDFSKTENRLNLEVLLPKGKGGKEPKVGVIGEETLTTQAKKAGVDLTISPNELPAYTDKAKLKDLADNYVLLAQPNLMAQVAKNLGQYLGPRGKLPKPIVGNVAELIEKAKKSVRIVSKGKYLPTVQSFVGTEAMSVDELVDNIDSVYDAIKNKVTEGNVKSVFVKLSMSKPVRVM